MAGEHQPACRPIHAPLIPHASSAAGFRMARPVFKDKREKPMAGEDKIKHEKKERDKREKKEKAKHDHESK